MFAMYQQHQFGVAPETCDPQTEFFDPATQTCQKFPASATATPIPPTVTPVTPTPAVPFFKKPGFWIAVAGVAAVGTGIFIFTRKPKVA